MPNPDRSTGTARCGAPFLPALLFAVAVVSTLAGGETPSQPAPPAQDNAAKREALLKQLGDPEIAEGLQALALREAVTLGLDGPALARVIGAACTSQSPALARGIVHELSESRGDAAGPALIGAWAALPPAARDEATELLLARPAWTRALLGAWERGTLSPKDWRLDQRAFLLTHPDAALREQARALLESRKLLPDTDRAAVLNTLAPQVNDPAQMKAADAQRGQALFEAQCAQCHRRGEVGRGRAGPELLHTALWERGEILSAILNPDAPPAPRFAERVFELHSGRLARGVVAGSTAATMGVEFAIPGGRVTVLPKANIAREHAGTRSAMPDGFEALGAGGLGDLLAFLAQPLPRQALDLRGAYTARSPEKLFNGVANDERFDLPRFGPWTYQRIPFEIAEPEDPAGAPQNNVIVLRSAGGAKTKELPEKVGVRCNGRVARVHLLGVVGGFAWPLSEKGTTAMTVRLLFADGTAEEHALLNGVHICAAVADADVPGSKQAFRLKNGVQLRHLILDVKRSGEDVKRIELQKGDESAPVVFSIVVERPQP